MLKQCPLSFIFIHLCRTRLFVDACEMNENLKKLRIQKVHHVRVTHNTMCQHWLKYATHVLTLPSNLVLPHALWSSMGQIRAHTWGRLDLSSCRKNMHSIRNENKLEVKELLGYNQSCRCQVNIYLQGTVLNHLCNGDPVIAHTVRDENHLLWWALLRNLLQEIDCSVTNTVQKTNKAFYF